MLCKFCQKIQPPHRAPIEDGKGNESSHWCIVKHHATFSSLLESAAQGCSICALFQPFVQHAVLRRDGLWKYSESDDIRSATSGYSHDDPFDYGDFDKDPDVVQHRETYIYRTKDLFYSDEGDHYVLLDNRGDEKYSALQDELQERAEEELKEDVAAGFPSQESKFKSKQNEIIQWLLQDESKFTGPEQLWVRSWIWVGDKDENPGLRERSTVLSLTAGSLNEMNDWSGDGFEYCVDGKVVAHREAEMAILYPYLYAWKFDPLHIPRKKPLPSLKPRFEFFEDGQTSVEDDASSTLVRAKSVAKDPTATFGLIKDWLSTCSKTHERCKVPLVPSPSRLLKVLDPDGRPIAKLVDSFEEIFEDGGWDVYDFAVLSHCWGTEPITTLTQANIESMKLAIDESALSPAFQDAFTITRGLSLRYLWIDALCIIQDSADDWHAESAKMSNYYQGCKVMLSALSSHSAGEKILEPRDNGPSAHISIDGNQIGLRRLLENAVSVASHLESWYSIRDDISVQPLGTRAWTFQEYTMAPRTIHFCAEQVIWQCNTCLASEDGQYTMSANKLPETRMEKAQRVKKTHDESRADKTRVGKPTPRPNLENTGWFKLVEKYTARRITFTADILPALAAIAQQVQSLTGATYCAGLWKGGPNTLYYNLLWTAMGSASDLSHACNGSPSWSWSSIRGEIYFGIWRDEIRLPKPYDPKFLDVKITLTSEKAPFGKVEDGALELEGWYHAYGGPETFAAFHASRRKARFEKNDSEDRSMNSSRDLYLNPLPELAALMLEDEEEMYWNEERLRQTYGLGSLDIPQEDYVWDDGTHILLFISEYCGSAREAKEKEPDTEQHYLILKRCGTLENTYCRVGYGQSDMDYRLIISPEFGWSQGKLRIV